MKRSFSVGIIVGTMLLLALIAFPVSGIIVPSTTAAASATTPASVTAGQPYISASVSPATATPGEPVTISGTATGGNLSAGVQIWAFAGNYINVTPVPVSTDGSFTKTYQTIGLPPATYYVIAQSPGRNGVLDIDMETTGKYSGQVVNTKTGNLVFNFTGTGSVHDSAAAQALSDAFNLPGVDDIYTKCTFQLASPGAAAASVTPAAPVSTTILPVPVATATKSPLSPFPLLAGAGIAGLVIAWRSRR
jgi:hypothetical protein